LALWVNLSISFGTWQKTGNLFFTGVWLLYFGVVGMGVSSHPGPLGVPGMGN